ncbi:hypothetical protein PR202_ga18584 [Eleusine coracana subsp. coracana]|uniref:DUF4408 domain-containing protein n=1 Tax=Eleusine coracana subsp. coracana TaxID=191504 RepID=A0AAV5CT36_ELECO|nr:hypothetical protein PR202_ga18584 [Eleusine coracana subsp. coracana]
MSSAHRGGGMSSHSSASLALAAKVGLASAALAGAASLARLAVPHLVSAGGAVLPRLWAVARFWLAPPYLFVTVHLIILVIWKLSDHKHFHHAHHKDPWPVSAQHQHTSPPVIAVDEVVAPAAIKVANKEEEEEFGAYAADYSSPDFSPDSGDSCVTTESDEDAASSSAASSSYYSSSMMEARRSVAVVAPARQERAAVLERDLSLPASQTVDGGDDDDMDATWNAIMQKTRSAPPAAAPASPPPAPAQQQQSPTRPPPRARDPSVGAEEMNRRFDDFIKKNRNSFGRHQ